MAERVYQPNVVSRGWRLFYTAALIPGLIVVGIATGWVLEIGAASVKPYPAWCQSLYPEIECQRVLDYRRTH